MEQATQATNQATKSVSQLDGTLSKLGGAMAAYFSLQAVKDFGVAVFNISKEMQSINVRMEGLQGNANKTNQALSSLRVTADKLGMDFMAMTNNYIQFVSAAKASGMEVQKAEKIFKSMSIAIAGSGASSEQAGRAMTALTQMIGKGKISAEELRGQLGEAMPAAFGIMAKSLGVTTDQLDKMMSSGQLMANDVLPKFAKEMEKAFGSNAQAMAEGMAGTQARLKNAWEGYMTSFGERFYGSMGGAEVLTDMINWWTEINQSQDQYISKESARMTAYSAESEALSERVDILRKQGKADEEILSTYEKIYKIELQRARNIKEAGGRSSEYVAQVKIVQSYNDIIKQLKEQVRLKNQIVPPSEAELKALEKQRKELIKIRLEGEKIKKDLLKPDLSRLGEEPDAMIGAKKPGADYFRKLRDERQAWQEKEAEMTKSADMLLAEWELEYFKEVEEEKTKITKEQADARKQLREENEQMLYQGIAQTSEAWIRHIGGRELEVRKQNLDKQREQGIVSEEAYLEQLKVIKRKQFLLDKLGAVASIAISTAINVAQASNPLMAPLIPGIIASGAIQAGLVLAQPVPYNKGTKRVPMLRGAVRGQDSVHAILTPGERVVPEDINGSPGYSKLLDLAQDRKISDKEAGFLADIAVSGMRPQQTTEIDPDVIGRAIAKHIPHTNVSINDRGIAVITERSHNETRRLKTRL